MKPSFWALIAGIALSVLLIVVAGPLAPLDRPAAAGTPTTVKVTKMPADVQHRTFDPRRPPREMPELKPPENAVCASVFLSNANVGAQGGQIDATHAKLTVNLIEITLQLKITIWLPPNPLQTVVAHEEGHRQIAEYFYKNADAIAKRVAEPYLGKTLDISGLDLRKAANAAVNKIGAEITDAYNKEMQVELTEARYDAITDHSRKDIPVPEAVAQAIRETAPASFRLAAPAGKK